MHRRNVLLATGGLATTLLAGCTGDGPGDEENGNGDGDDADLEEGDAEANADEENGDENGEAEPEEEGEDGEGDADDEGDEDPEDAAEGEDVEEHSGLEIVEHEFVTDEFSGSIDGIVENNSGEQQDYVQVQARVYDADGNQLDSHMDNTTDLDDGATWSFSIPVLDYEDVEEYDIQVNDSPF